MLATGDGGDGGDGGGVTSGEGGAAAGCAGITNVGASPTCAPVSATSSPIGSRHVGHSAIACFAAYRQAIDHGKHGAGVELPEHLRKELKL